MSSEFKLDNDYGCVSTVTKAQLQKLLQGCCDAVGKVPFGGCLTAVVEDDAIALRIYSAKNGDSPLKMVSEVKVKILSDALLYIDGLKNWKYFIGVKV